MASLRNRKRVRDMKSIVGNCIVGTALIHKFKALPHRIEFCLLHSTLECVTRKRHNLFCNLFRVKSIIGRYAILHHYSKFLLRLKTFCDSTKTTTVRQQLQRQSRPPSPAVTKNLSSDRVEFRLIKELELCNEFKMWVGLSTSISTTYLTAIFYRHWPLLNKENNNFRVVLACLAEGKLKKRQIIEVKLK